MSTGSGERSEQVERRVVSMDWEGVAARAVITRRTYPTEIGDLWDAVTNPDRLKRWFLPATGDLREGGNYQLEGNAGGSINRCEPPRLLALTWETGGGIGWLNVKLEESDGASTRVTLEHIAQEDADFLEFWDQFGPGAVGVGWDLGLLGLAEYLATGDSPFGGDEDAWMGTEHGRAFARESSDAWAAAAIGFGTDAQEARAAGERTFAFYTGAGP
jgi:uncharacterized protein YndB with AHSA1/START domain